MLILTGWRETECDGNLGCGPSTQAGRRETIQDLAGNGFILGGQLEFDLSKSSHLVSVR